MKKLLSAAAAATLICTPAFAADKAALVEDGKALIMKFGGALKGELQAAMKAKGAPHAIEVCSIRAVEIETEAAGDSGWTISRSSHKLRNPANAPDDYTGAVIEEFLARQEAGEKAEDLVKAEIVELDGRQVFRMVKAIPTAEVCLNCHGGDEVKQPVVDQLAKLYPGDQARGFTVGEMRGVFTLAKPLN